MRLSICALAAVLLSSTSLSGCLGSGLGAMDGHSYAQGSASQGHAQYNAGCFVDTQAALTQPVFMRNAPGCLEANTYPVAGTGLRGSSPSYYNTYDQGTVLRGSAPYGSAVNNAAYHHTARPEKNSGAYVNLGGVAYNVGERLYGIQGRAGYNFNRYLGAEAEASFGVIGDDTTGPLSISNNVEVNSAFGAFAVARAPIGKRVTLLARGGYHVLNVTNEDVFNIGGNTVTTNIDTRYNGAAAGIGVEFATGPSNAVRLDYTRYVLDSGNGSSQAVAASFVHKF